MRKPAVLAVAAIVLSGVIAAGVYVWIRTTAPAQWAVVQHPLGDRLSQKTRVVREFGDWHLACKTEPSQPAPKIGFIRNFGILPQRPIDEAYKNCRAFIFMANRNNPQQVMVLDLRFGPENTLLIATAVYPVLGKVGDKVTLKLNQETLQLGAQACGHKRCYATLDLAGQDIDNLAKSELIAAQLPPSADGKVNDVNIPTRGLSAALAALRQLNPF